MLNLFSFLGEWAKLEIREGWRSWGADKETATMEQKGVEISGQS